MVQVEVSGRGVRREEAPGDRVTSVGVIDREVHVARERSRRPDLQHAFETRNADLRDVHGRNDRGSRYRRVVDTGCALLPVAGKFCDQAEREAVYVSHLEEIVPLG